MCCYLSKKELADSEGSLIADHILACSPQAGKIALKSGAKALVLTHIREKNQAQMEEVVKEINEDFQNKVIAGQDLLIIDV